MWSPSRLPGLPGRLPFATPGVAETADLPASVARPFRPLNAVAAPSAEPMVTVEFSYTRGELLPVLAAIRDTLGCGALPLDTPARLQEALATVIRSVGGNGDPNVRRSPAALLTPEYWHLRFDATDERTLATLADIVGRRASR